MQITQSAILIQVMEIDPDTNLLKRFKKNICTSFFLVHCLFNCSGGIQQECHVLSRQLSILQDLVIATLIDHLRRKIV